MNKRELAVVNEVIEGLLRTCDFLDLQLDHAWGNITKKDFEKRLKPYLKRGRGKAKSLKEKLIILKRLGIKSLGADEVSSIFQADFETAISLVEEVGLD
jgi:hypothetical protein